MKKSVDVDRGHGPPFPDKTGLGYTEQFTQPSRTSQCERGAGRPCLSSTDFEILVTGVVNFVIVSTFRGEIGTIQT